MAEESYIEKKEDTEVVAASLQNSALEVSNASSSSSPEQEQKEKMSRTLSPIRNFRARAGSRSPRGSPKRSVSPKSQYPGSRDLKRVKVNEPKQGRIYPSLTDIDATETETDVGATEEEEIEEDLDSSGNSLVSGFSLGTHIERVAKQNVLARKPHYRPSETVNILLIFLSTV